MRCAILPARGGSVRIPRKNIREFRGRPMIQWPIEAARASGLFDHIIVSTDDVEIAGLTRALGHEVHMRSQDDGSTGTQEIAARVLQWLHAAPSDECCVIYPCSPLLSPLVLSESHRIWLSYAEHYLYSTLRNGTDAGCLYWGEARSFIARQSLEAHGRQYCCQVNGADCFIDINTEEDWSRAEAMFDALNPS